MESLSLKGFKNMQIQHLETLFSGELGSGGLAVELDDLKLPKQFYDCMWAAEPVGVKETEVAC